MNKKSESFNDKLNKIREKVPQSMGQMVDFGKLPPQAIHIEEAVLGALMIDKNALIDVLDLLNEKVFYKDEHKEIYRALILLFQDNKPIDILTVTDSLLKRGTLEQIGGAYYIVELTNRVGSAANIEYHARIMVEKYIMRELIRVSSEIQKSAYDETTDVFNLIDKAESLLFNIIGDSLRGDFRDMPTLVNKTIEQIEMVQKNRNDTGLSGVPSGIQSVDRITNGWQNSDFIIIAGRPGMGKTAFVLTMARNAAVDFKIPVAVFSLEMSATQLVKRLISGETPIENEKLKSGDVQNFEWQNINNKVDRLINAKIFIDDTPAINIFELRAKAKRIKSRQNVGMIIIDYLQLMGSTNDKRIGNREQEISAISRGLKALAKELNVPVVALSQLSREVEKRGGNKRPLLSDLRESGSIEQDADQVSFIYRPEYYNITEDENGSPTKGVAEFIHAKNRSGSIGTANMYFDETITTFTDFDNNALIDGIIISNDKAPY